ncbi:MAG: hypothetical protein J6B30_04585 [Muribaculaceae bacterium]|nr:hypothetical protein [Muribaculaceae bacterium]
MDLNKLKLALSVAIVFIMVACGEEKQQEIVENSESYIVGEKAIKYEDVGEDFIDRKLAELSQIVYDAKDVKTVKALLDYQEKQYAKNLKKFEETNKAKIDKLSKAKKQKYAAAQRVFEDYFGKLFKIEHAEDLIRKKEAEEQKKREAKAKQDSIEGKR